MKETMVRTRAERLADQEALGVAALVAADKQAAVVRLLRAEAAAERARENREEYGTLDLGEAIEVVTGWAAEDLGEGIVGSDDIWYDCAVTVLRDWHDRDEARRYARVHGVTIR